MLRETPNNETVIVEYGFLDNTRDANKLKNNYKDYAEAVVKSVMEYKGLTYVPPKGSAVPPINSTDNTYTVKSGDTLWTIAKNYGLTVNELKALNNLTSNLLSVGQELIVNESASIPSGNSYIVKQGDTLYAIANKYGTTVNKLKSFNNLTSNTLSIGQIIAIPTNDDYKVYTVQKGDTLYSIATKNGTTVDKLKVINNLNSNILSIGQKLLIP